MERTSRKLLINDNLLILTRVSFGRDKVGFYRAELRFKVSTNAGVHTECAQANHRRVTASCMGVFQWID